MPTELFAWFKENLWLVIAVAGLLFLAFAWKLVARLFGIIIIPDDSIGLVTKKFVLFGSHRDLPPGKIIALKGEAGLQADTLAPGLKFGYWPWQYEVQITQFLVVPNGQIAIVEACDGKPMAEGHILGRQVECDNFQDARAFLENGGERGAQMAVIPPGTWRINTLVFRTDLVKMEVIPAGKIGVVEAKDGKPLSGGRIIGRHVDCDSFQDAQAFMTKGGERGPQMTIIPQGQYRINPKLFTVTMEDVTDIPDNMVGIVTTKEGAPLISGTIAGREVAGHNMFQDPQAFVDHGGSKGLQEQVLLAGRYFINSRFATVEVQEMTKVPIANVGVVIAYVGDEGVDVTGDSFKHGNLVSQGREGRVGRSRSIPGKYPINPYTHKVEVVPTANVVLNWATGKSEAHNLDKNLSTITVRSSDGFTFNLDVSQIIHIPRTEAPKVIARFGSMANLVTQVLEPTIGNYFRNAAQNSDVIDFLKQRSKRQNEAKQSISAAPRGIQRRRGRHAHRRHHATGRADEDAHRPQTGGAGADHLRHAGAGGDDPQEPGAGEGDGRHAAGRRDRRAVGSDRELHRGCDGQDGAGPGQGEGGQRQRRRDGAQDRRRGRRREDSCGRHVGSRSHQEEDGGDGSREVRHGRSRAGAGRQRIQARAGHHRLRRRQRHRRRQLAGQYPAGVRDQGQHQEGR